MKRPLVHLLEIGLVTAVYFLAGRLGLSLAFLYPSASPIWPPTGIALAALLLRGQRLWLAVFVGAFLVNLTATPWVGVPASLGIAIGNTLEAVCGARLVRRFANGERAFDRPADLMRFAALAGLASTMISATIGVASLLMLASPGGEQRLVESHMVWLTWWLGNASSNLVLAPLLLVWGRSAPALPSGRRALEAAGVLAALLAAAMITFTVRLGPEAGDYPLPYFTIPPLLWAALRFGPRGATAVAFALSCIAVWVTLGGTGPFAVEDANEGLLLLQGFMATVTVTVLLVAAALAERRRTEQALRFQKLVVESLTEVSPDGILVVDSARRVLFVNQRFVQMWGMPEEVVSGRSSQAALRFAQERVVEPEAFVDRIRHLYAHPEQSSRDEIVLRDGRTLERYSASLRSAKGVCLGRVWFYRDVTAQRVAERERENLLAREQTAREEAERANRAKDEFIAMLSHELRTPLTPVLLTLSLMEEADDLPQRVRADVKELRHNVELEARLIDDLLDLTRISRGKLRLHLESADVHVLLRSAIEMCCRVSGRDVDVELRAQRHHVCADPARLQQVFCNLLSNACKFTPVDGTITVRTANPHEGRLSIEIRDTGIGIEPETLPRLFDAFEQGDALIGRQFGGLGLGLAISKALIDAHGGLLSAQSEGRGRGATFTIELATMEQCPAGRVNGEPAGCPPACPGMRILVVEDHPATQQAMAKVLSSLGYNVVTAGSVSSAMVAVASGPVNLVISDLGLPDGSGHDLIKAIKQRYAVKGIALSGYGMEDDLRRSREAGFDEHLTKPVDLQRLQRIVQKVILET